MGFAVSEGGPDLTPGSATRQLCDFGSVSQRLRAVNSHWGIIEPSFFTGQEPGESPPGDRPSGSKRDFAGQGLSWESSRDAWEVTSHPAPPHRHMPPPRHALLPRSQQGALGPGRRALGEG